jgi:hypothetical protein
MLYILPRSVTQYLYSFVDGLRDLHYRFYGLYSDTKNIPILGTWLSTPFWYVAALFDDAATNVYQFAGWLETVINALNSALSYVNLDTAIRALWGDFWYIVHYPTSWVQDRLTSIVKDAQTFINNPGTWIVNRIRDYSNDAWGWVTATEGKLRTFIYNTSTGAYNLFYDQSTFLVNLAYKKDYQLGKLFADPLGYIKSLIPAIPTIPGDLISNPGGFITGWLMTELEDRVPSYKDRLYSLAEKTIRLLWEGIF